MAPPPRANRPAPRPVIAAVVLVDLRRAAELAHPHTTVFLPHARSTKSLTRRPMPLSRRGPLPVRMALKTAGVVVPTAEVHLDRGDALLDQLAGQQAAHAEAVLGTAVLFNGLFGLRC